ncbi:MAG: hypothetical protein OEM67_12335 [Thermoleophilia bacterium]|nr:hypothetical protein [Thermoleophilia bacterium]MDH3725162.1 hypothetical protein [Thermoleophilia bacterium]
MSLNRPAPTGRRAVAITIVLSLLVAGLGHIYIGRLPRALIWFAGILVVSVVVSQGDASLLQSAGLGAALSVAAAIDAVILLRFK